MRRSDNNIRFDARDFTESELIAGMRGRVEGLPAPVAVALFAKSDKPRGDILDALVEVSHDDSVSEHAKSVAAWEMRRFPDVEAADALLQVLSTGSSLVKRRAGTALGLIGTESTLGQLTGIEAGAEAKHAEWAATLIAHRIGKEGMRPALTHHEEIKLTFLVLGEPDESDREFALAFLKDTYGELITGDGPASSVSCDGVRHLFFPSQRVVEDAEQLASTPALAGFVVRHDQATGGWVNAYLVLTDPVDDGFAFAVATENGRIRATGQGELDDARIAVVFDMSEPGESARFTFADGRTSGSGNIGMSAETPRLTMQPSSKLAD